MKVTGKALSTVKKFFPQVEEVTDATEPIDVEVTNLDSANSKLKHHAKCALAVACKRSEKADGVIVSVSTAYVIKGNQAIRYCLPDTAAREVVSFDRGSGYDPGMYHLRAPSKSQRLGKKSYSTGKVSTNPAHKVRPFKQQHHTAKIRTSLRMLK